jgi:plastocyanin
MAFAAVALTAFPSAAAATPDPSGVSTTLQGCRNGGPGVPYPSTGPFVCADSAYTTGNLGKGWNELDLVPFRLTVHAGNSAPATQTYAIGIAADNCADKTGGSVTCADGNAGYPGFDVMSTPVLNTALSSASCTSLSTPGQQTVNPGINASVSLGEVLTITQQQSTTCVYDYYQRVALGAHLFPGSSLHAYLADQALAKQQGDVPIPVGEIAPQSLSKNMSATQGSDHAWNLTKGATPATLDFGNTCVPANTQLPLQIKVTWTKVAASPYGQITVITNVYAANPASRPITTNVSDQITGVPNPLLSPATASTVVPANTANYLVLTDTQQVPSGTTNLSDVATATYTDTVTGVPIPGSTQATASATVAQTGSELDQSATITDAETISGTNYSFSVAAPAVGGFTGGYVHDTKTSGEVDWSSGSVSDSGSITFNKTVYVSVPSSGSGELDDTAVLQGSDFATTGTGASATASVALSSNKLVSLEIDKTIPAVLQAGDPDQTFTFDVFDSSGNKVATKTLTFTAGGGLSASATVSNLAPDTYTVKEETLTGWAPQPDVQVPLTSACSGNARFANKPSPALAQAIKVTDPAGHEAGWVMTLSGPGAGAGGESETTNANGLATFTTALQEGSYTISETPQAGWASTSSTGCSFTVNYPADGGQTFTCTIHNQEQAKIIVKKVTIPAGSTQQFTFTPSYGTSFQLGDAGSNDSGYLAPGSGYSVSESATTGWDLTGATCDDGDSPSSITLTPGQTVTCTFTNTQRGNIIVKKVTAPSGSSQQFTFTPTGYNSGNTFQLSDGQSKDSGPLLPGSGYAVSESPTAGWDLTSATCSNGNSPSSITLSPGQTVTCTFTNTQRGKIVVKKTTNPSGSSQLFTFNPSYGSSFQLGDTGSNDSGYLLPGSGYSVSEAATTGWDLTSATCDNGSQVTNITVNAGQTVTCTFVNTQRGQIVIKKKTNPSGSSQLFTFNPSYGSSFQLADGGSQPSAALIPKSGYSVSEAPTTGWDLTSAMCDNGSPVTNITVNAGQTVTCTFTNTQRGKAKVVKTVNGAPPSGTQSFTFELRQGASATAAGTTLETGTANAADGGVITFTTLLVPGQTYQLCEQMMVGWMTTLGPPLFSVYNPSGDNSVVCADFTVSAGQTLTFNIDNKPPPGGMALTIGYWKNWSSCTGGKQKPVLDQTLLALANAGTPETLGALVINPLTLGATTACNYAVNILSKTTINGKTKMASDPLFNLAAQLLAADLNVGAGAGQCSASATAINQAHVLLAKYGFDGLSSSSKLKVTPADATLANNLATSLDKYNNNQLC